MSKLYQYKYDNGLIDGVVYLCKEGSTVMNANGCFNKNGFKTKKAAKEHVERVIGASLKSMPIK